MRRAVVAVVLASLVFAPTVGASREEPARNEGIHHCDPMLPVGGPACALFSQANLTADCGPVLCTITVEAFAFARADLSGVMDITAEAVIQGVAADSDFCLQEPLRQVVAPILPADCPESYCAKAIVGTVATCAVRQTGTVSIPPGDHVWVGSRAYMDWNWPAAVELVMLDFVVERLDDGSIRVVVLPTGEE